MDTGSTAATGLAAPRASERRTDSPTQGGLDREAFMQLLVTQLQNQDPLDPMDASQMVTQLSELTSVEQLVAIEGRMSALEVGIGSVANTQVSSLVGKTVVADGSHLRLGEGGVDAGFSLDGRAEDVQVVIRDAQGDIVRRLDLGEHMPGPSEFHWDGLDDSGEPLPEGRYRMEITAKGAGGVPVEVDTEVSGLVTSVGYAGGFPELEVDGRKVLLGDVRSIGQ